MEARERASWDAHVAAHPEGHVLQSWRWGEFRSAWGWTPKRLMLQEGDHTLAAVQLLFRPTPLGPIAYVPRGPVCAPTADLMTALLSEITSHTARAFAVRFEPGWSDGAALPDQWGLVPAPDTQPRSTAVVDLTLPEADLLAGMHPKWRYNLGLAERRGVSVREGGEADLATFAQLMRETAHRDHFHARESEYYAWAWRAFKPDAHLYLAERDGETLAALMCFHFGAEAIYLYGASSDSGRRDMPNHILQWEALRRARAAGLRRYDLWGIPDAIGAAATAGADPLGVDASSDPLWGVWRFKRGLPVQVRRTVGAWDLVISPARHRLFTLLTGVRSRRRS